MESEMNCAVDRKAGRSKACWESLTACTPSLLTHPDPCDASLLTHGLTPFGFPAHSLTPVTRKVRCLSFSAHLWPHSCCIPFSLSHTCDQVRFLSFSAHTDLKGILQMITTVAPAAVILVHGERTPMTFLSDKARLDIMLLLWDLCVVQGWWIRTVLCVCPGLVDQDITLCVSRDGG
jgi:Zn-dependent metallo-hydrolase RNA specificity domain